MATRTPWLGVAAAMLAAGTTGCSQTPSSVPVSAPTFTSTEATTPSSARPPSATTSTPTQTPTATGPTATGPIATTPAATTGTEGPGSTRRVVVTLAADGSVTPNGERIDLAVGEPLTLEIRGERDDELHVHGIDLGIPVNAGETVTETVNFDMPGSYEVESHDPARVVVVIRVR